MSYTLIFYIKSGIEYDGEYKSSFFHFETFSTKNELIEVLGKLIYENEYPDEYHILSSVEKNSEISLDEKNDIMKKSLEISVQLKNEAIQKHMEETKRYQELLEKNKIESEKIYLDN